MIEDTAFSQAGGGRGMVLKMETTLTVRLTGHESAIRVFSFSSPHSRLLRADACVRGSRPGF